MSLRRVDPTGPPGALGRAYAGLATTRLARFVARRILWKLDPLLLRLSGGSASTTLMFPTALLETRGARSGQPRQNALIYFNDGDGWIVIASNAGSLKHPSWYHNLLAYPDVVFGGIPMRAQVVDDVDERNRLWVLADRVFPAFATYRSETSENDRTIPIVRLTASATTPGNI